LTQAKRSHRSWEAKFSPFGINDLAMAHCLECDLLEVDPPVTTQPQSNRTTAFHGANGAVQLAARLDEIDAAGSAEALRARLGGRWPALARGKLEALAIVGAAGEGLRLASICAKSGIEVVAVVDDDPRRHGTAAGGRSVAAVENLASLDRAIPVVVASHRALKPCERVRAMGFECVAPFMALQMLEPERFAPHPFHERLLEDLVDNASRLARLGERLADDFSRAVLAAAIGYRLEGDPRVLAPVVEWDLYGPGNLLAYGEDEVYVDGGSYDGDSIRLFIERVGGRYERILAFEPDPATFARLQGNLAAAPRVQPINAGLHRRTATLRFDDAGTRGSLLAETGGIAVPVVGLDEVLRGERVTYLKMNIEAAEIEALHGAAASIRRWAPKLAISAYHRAEHLWRVPETILELRPDYRLYFRQHDGGIIETVTYAMV
jgi:FkbM family methyltransferase